LQNADYLVVVELLSHPDGRTRDQLIGSLNIELETLDDALERLQRDDVIVRDGSLIRTSNAVRRLSQLNLIAL
jgi:hypothetical protein